MFHSIKRKLHNMRINYARSITKRASSHLSSTIQLPASADVVVIGGGSAGCNALYHLGKHGIDAILLDKSKLTSGTTWHTGGLIWSIRGPYDVEMELLNVTKRIVNSLENETGVYPGWIKNGGLYIARTDERWSEYKRLVTGGKAFGLDAHLVSPQETKELFPLWNESDIQGAIYSSEDGCIDPTMLINALTNSARSNNCQIIEDCPVTKILTKETARNNRKVYGVETPYGIIKTDVVLNAAGVWSKNLANTVNLNIPLTPIKHAYVVTESMEGIHQNVPNVRDNDLSTYYRIQGTSLTMGGYELNPILLPSAPEDFSFSLYELDWNAFNVHMKAMIQAIPELSKTGIKATICGPESFTPDHKPIMGEDPRCSGLFYSCAYNSAGIMLGGGCGEQIARWIINGRPDKHMYDYDIRRFLPEQRNNSSWINGRSYEAYGKNYNIVFPYDEPLSGRNFKTDPFHESLVERGAVMEECHGWEQPAWFLPAEKAEIVSYDFNTKPNDSNDPNDKYRTILKAECTFNFSPYDNMVREEALACLKNVALFNVSHRGKFYLCGPDAQKAADYLFTADTNRSYNETIYTCMLNRDGGVEADCTLTILEPGSGGLIDPIFKDKGFYIVSSGVSIHNTWVHMNKAIEENSFDVSLHDVTEQIGILSVEGPNSINIMKTLIKDELTFKYSTTKLIKKENEPARLIRLSIVDKSGFELHIPKSSCQLFYTILKKCGESYNMKDAGYRALRSLSLEKGHLLWGSDLRIDDNPLEAGLEFTCRSTSEYLGKTAIDRLRQIGVKKKLVAVHLNSSIPLWGLEAIYRDDRLVGYLRRAEQGYNCGNVIGHGYIKHPDGENVTKEFLETGNYQIECMGKRYTVNLHL